MINSKETPAEQRARLMRTPEGRALQALIDMFPAKQDLAKALGSSAEYISRCAGKGKISKSGAKLADKKGLMSKEELRPDVTDWDSVPPGLLIGARPKRDGVHQVLLRDLVNHFGSVRAFCKAMGVTDAAFHRYNSRNSISPQGMLKLVALNGLSDDLRARVMAEVDRISKAA
ncbi:hypothetical protein KLEP174_gp51 [Pseudomonas phage vB_PcuM_ KLEP17-4]|nr:hypothetical protein KLEP174_gp51 [Pseudomonas phage vB_PcuM_ KLEP17-4]